MKYIVGLIILSAVFSCDNQQKKQISVVQKKQNWAFFKIEINNQLIWIPNDQDTCFYREKIFDANNAEKNYGKWKTEEKRFVLTKQQRDSVFLLGEDAIKNFVETNQTVSCYAGQYVTLTLDNSTNSISCKYSSISDWTKISKKLYRISELTFEKID